MSARRTVLVAAVTALLTAALVGVGAMAWANHQFSDVPTNSAFHESISNLVDAGCATGFPNGTYKPTDPVNRQQIARMLNTCGGRLATSDSLNGDSAIGTSNTTMPSSTATLEPGAIQGGGYVLAIGNLRVSSFSGSGYPCDVFTALDATGDSATLVNASSGTSLNGQNFDAGATPMAAFLVEAGQTLSVSLVAREDNSCAASLFGNGEVTLLYFPFAGDGTGVGVPD
jgi:hypothetical protein